jgi:hypothetical protein
MTPHGRLRRRLLTVATLGTLPASHLLAASRPPGEHITSLLPGAQLVGAGRYTWLGLAVYDAALYAPAGRFASEGPYALELTYARAFKGAAIAERSIEEMRRQGPGIEGRAEAWRARLDALFPDVARGDTLTGVLTRYGDAAFFHNARPIGRIDDTALARSFFGIWLDPQTSAPNLRARLTGSARNG